MSETPPPLLDLPQQCTYNLVRQSGGGCWFARITVAVDFAAAESEVLVAIAPERLAGEDLHYYAPQQEWIEGAVAGCEEALRFFAVATGRAFRVTLLDVIGTDVDTNFEGARFSAGLAVVQAVTGHDLQKGSRCLQGRWFIPFELTRAELGDGGNRSL